MSLIIENNNRHEHNGNGIAIDQNVSTKAYVKLKYTDAY